MIKTQAQHKKALTEIKKLIAIDPSPRVKEGKRLRALGAAIGRYEKKHFPIAKPTPAEAKAFRKEQKRKMTRATLMQLASAGKAYPATDVHRLVILTRAAVEVFDFHASQKRRCPKSCAFKPLRDALATYLPSKKMLWYERNSHE